jgi:hypothetical protein
MVYNNQMRGQGFLSSVVVYYRAAVGGCAFSGGAMPPGLNISWMVDHLGTCVIESLHGVDLFTRACLSYVRTIMVFMCASLFELLCQAVMGQVPALEYLLLGARGLLWPSPIMPGT